MYGINLPTIYHQFMPNVGKYAIHGWVWVRKDLGFVLLRWLFRDSTVGFITIKYSPPFWRICFGTFSIRIFSRKSKGLFLGVPSGKLIWSPKMEVWFRWFLGSMLIFGGVYQKTPENANPCWTKTETHLLQICGTSLRSLQVDMVTIVGNVGKI